MFGFEKGSKLLEFAIQLTRENCLRYNTCGVMSGAGPDFLTAAVSYFDDPDVVFVHKNHLINRRFITNQSVTYHTMDATWLRRKKPQKELIKEEFQGRDGSTVFFCGFNKWKETNITCEKRAQFLVERYKILEQNAKSSILESGCLCIA